MKERIEELLSVKDYGQIRAILKDENEVDVAALLEEFSETDLLIIFRLLPKDMAAEVFSYLPVKDQHHLVETLSNREVATIIDDLYTDDAVDLLEEMPANVVKKVLSLASPETRKDINLLLKYPADSAGSIMTTEFVDLRAELTVEEAIQRVKALGIDSETINVCYVINDSRQLIGIVTLRTLLLSDSDVLIENLMTENVKVAHTNDDQEKIAQMFQKYDFYSIAVVDNENRLVGIVTVDDIMDILQEENTEDIEKMAAIVPTEKSYMELTVSETYKKRIPWLLLLMISASITGGIITSFENALASYVVLTAYIPMLMDTGGNAGSQASVSVIRAISLGEIEFRDILKVFFKEFRVSICVGATLAVANFAKLMLFDRLGASVALVVCLTLFLTVIIAKMVGCLLPMIAKKLGFDPAIMASPFITTIVDAMSLMIYFNIATALLHL